MATVPVCFCLVAFVRNPGEQSNRPLWPGHHSQKVRVCPAVLVFAGCRRVLRLSCLILSALGCDRETIVHDYLKTNEAARHIDACNQVAQHLWCLCRDHTLFVCSFSSPSFCVVSLCPLFRFVTLQRWRQLAAESPERWQRMQATLPTLRFDATWPGLDGSERPPAETSPAETADATRESQSESEARLQSSCGTRHVRFTYDWFEYRRRLPCFRVRWPISELSSTPWICWTVKESERDSEKLHACSGLLSLRSVVRCDV